MARPGKAGIARIIAAAGYSMKGLDAAWKHEAAFRQEVALVVLAIPLAIYWAPSRNDLLWLLLPLFLVLLAELTNSAIEAIVDRISDEDHELSGRAKDIGSALVFIALGATLIIWAVVLWPG